MASGGNDGLDLSSDRSDITAKYGDLFKCTICLERYKTPRALPCLHSFCETCLENHIKVNLKVIPARLCSVFTCPTCREEVTFPSGGVKGFRRDFRVEQLHDYLSQAESDDTRSGSPEENPSCQFCEAKSTDGEMSYCNTCSKRICSACLSRHRRKSIFSNHIILSHRDEERASGRGDDFSLVKC